MQTQSASQQASRQSAAQESQASRQAAAQESQASRQSAQSANREDWQSYGQQQQQSRQSYGQQQQQSRQNYASNYDDYHGGCCYGGAYGRYYPSTGGAYAAGVVTGAVIGSTMTAAAFSAQASSCTTVIAHGVTYYQCGSTWYQPTTQGSQVTYIVVNPPK
jgi:uncharacterized membrane protein YdbT with pleckstrin-like domain